MNNSFNKTEKRGNDNMEVEIEDRVITKRTDKDFDTKYLEFKLKDISNLDEILKVIDVMEQNNIMKATQININNEINMPLRVNNIERSNDDIESIAQKFEGCIIHKDNELKIGEASIKFKLI